MSDAEHDHYRESDVLTPEQENLRKLIMSGSVRVVPVGDPRYCQIAEAHDDHEFVYEYDRPEHLGGHTHGRYWCNGAPLLPQPPIHPLTSPSEGS